MYARIFRVNVRPEKLEEFPNAFGELILKEITLEPGFKGLYLLRDGAANKVVALVLWETQANALASAEGYMRQRLPKMAEYLSGPPEAETLEVVLRA